MITNRSMFLVRRAELKIVEIPVIGIKLTSAKFLSLKVHYGKRTHLRKDRVS
jgi:hypothetical protein